MNALEIKSLRKDYKDFTLGPLDLTLPTGCILGLIGENGAGKSTTIKLILNMIHRESGTVTIYGRDNREILTKEDLGVVLDEVGFPSCLNACQMGKVMEGVYRHWDSALYAEYLRWLDVPEKKVFKDLSRGMKTKLGIAVALSHRPRLLLLDEATNGLDPVVREQVTDIFSEFTRDEDHGVLISSHIVSDLEKICDYVAFLHRGKLLLLEEKDRLQERYGVLHCTPQALEELPARAIHGKKVSAYGMEVLVDRTMVPKSLTLSPVDMEQLFIFMVREAV